jgi:hypothetical protein
MRRNRLGCLTGTGILAALITAFLIAGYAVASGGSMFSPGHLNASRGSPLGGVTSHAEIAGACNTCHTSPWESQTMDDQCVVCHTDIPAQLADIQTAHGRMNRIDPKAKCRECHPEHRGSTASLTELDDWKYPHQLSGYSLTAHQFTSVNRKFRCADCHGIDVTIFDVRVCSTCHGLSDMAFTTNHILAYGRDCLDCHDGIDSLGRSFAHDKFAFKLTGGHVGVACEKCHVNAHDLAGFKALAQDCSSCHGKDDPHGGSLGNDCASCHSPEGWKIVNFDHNRAAFKLSGFHVNVTCANCHKNGIFKGTPGDCFSCHQQDDRHNGELGTECASCHKPTTWKDVSFDHSRTLFPLIGKHANLACANCHKNSTFKNTPLNCASCHVDVHSGQMGNDCAGCHNPTSWKDVNFDHSKTGFPLIGDHKSVPCTNCHANGVYTGTAKDCFACHASKDVHKGQFGTDCASCHSPSGWKNVTFDHGKTAFPLTGEHAKVQCTSCHINNVYKGTAKNCYACHASKDSHGGQFGTDCASCHTASGWKNVNFDHSKTAFPLTGGHTTVQCKACHVNGVFKGTPKDCYACHASKDPHNGQFGKVCSTCHNTTSWKGATFNHGNTAFPLAGSHANVACTSCHINNVYKGTPKNCYACHAARDKHNGQFGTDCGACHKPTKWSDVNFNHNNTNFPLSGKHTGVQCQACHVNGVYKGTPTNCYACHAAKDKHNGQFGTDCGSCHNPGGWGNATFDHNNTAFPLTGKHSKLSCTKCHSNGVYKGTPTQCIACHADKDKHKGTNGTDCGACHTPTDWGNVVK